MNRRLISHHAWRSYFEEYASPNGNPDLLYDLETILLTETGLPLETIRGNADLAIAVRTAILETV